MADILPFKPKKSSDFEPLTDAKGIPIKGYTRHKPSGFIHVRKKFRRLGIPEFRQTTNETTIGKAKTVGQMLIQQHINKYLGIDDSHALVKKREKTFRCVAKEVLEDYTPTQRKGTQELHKSYINELIQHWGEMDINAITDRSFNELIRKLRKMKKRQTFFDYQKAASLVMGHAYQQKYCSHLVKFTNPDKGRKPEVKVFSEEEIKALWEVMNEETRDQFVLCYENFMRLREALHLTWERVDLKTGIVTLRAQDVKTGSKTGKGREFKLSPVAHSRLIDRYAVKGKSPYVFPSPVDPMKPVHQNKTAWRIAKREANKVLVKKELPPMKGRAKWHSLRHTALTKALLEKRMNPVAVSEFAGVSLKTVQSVYLHSTAEHTQDVSGAVSICGANLGQTRGKQNAKGSKTS